MSLKTQPTDVKPADYIASFKEPMLSQGQTLLKLFQEVTGDKGTMWGKTIVGFGAYEYTNTTGKPARWPLTGFALRKSGPTIYIMPGVKKFSDLLTKLGPHKHGCSCLNLKSLEGIDLRTLKKMVKESVKMMKDRHDKTWDKLPKA